MIKDDQGSPSANSVERQLTQLGIAQGANVSNEIIALQSLALMSEVVKRLQLNINYVVKGFFHDHTLLYGTEFPVRVKFLSLEHEDGATLIVNDATNGQFTITGFASKDTQEGDADKLVKGLYNQVVRIPVGRVLLRLLVCTLIKPSSFFVRT